LGEQLIKPWWDKTILLGEQLTKPWWDKTILLGEQLGKPWWDKKQADRPFTLSDQFSKGVAEDKVTA